MSKVNLAQAVELCQQAEELDKKLHPKRYLMKHQFVELDRAYTNVVAKYTIALDRLNYTRHDGQRSGNQRLISFISEKMTIMLDRCDAIHKARTNIPMKLGAEKHLKRPGYSLGEPIIRDGHSMNSGSLERTFDLTTNGFYQISIFNYSSKQVKASEVKVAVNTVSRGPGKGLNDQDVYLPSASVWTKTLQVGGGTVLSVRFSVRQGFSLTKLTTEIRPWWEGGGKAQPPTLSMQDSVTIRTDGSESQHGLSGSGDSWEDLMGGDEASPSQDEFASYGQLPNQREIPSQPPLTPPLQHQQQPSSPSEEKQQQPWQPPPPLGAYSDFLSAYPQVPQHNIEPPKEAPKPETPKSIYSHLDPLEILKSSISQLEFPAGHPPADSATTSQPFAGASYPPTPRDDKGSD